MTVQQSSSCCWVLFCFVFYDYRCVHILNTQHGPGPVLGALQTLLTVSNLWCYCYYCHFNEEWYKQTNDISNSISCMVDTNILF